jgi:hypothetical protein
MDRMGTHSIRSDVTGPPPATERYEKRRLPWARHAPSRKSYRHDRRWIPWLSRSVNQSLIFNQQTFGSKAAWAESHALFHPPDVTEETDALPLHLSRRSRPSGEHGRDRGPLADATPSPRLT